MKGSIIIAVLESYEVVRRQVLWFDRWMKPFADRWELVIVDDGSEPAIEIEPPKNYRLRLLRVPPHEQPWTQPAARNLGVASCVNSEYVYMTDIDHIITPEAVEDADQFDGDKLHFHRQIGALDERGVLLLSDADLLAFGAQPKDLKKRDEHYNTFSIRKAIHDKLGGYDERFCGKYGGDDTDYARRYGELHYSGGCKRSEMSRASIYVFPDPKSDRKEIFHSLRRRGHTEWN
jgi:glycosyltransferase involved in cell wall biosynthesis